MAGDKDQTIYQIQTPIIRSGIDITGNSLSLKTNFRNTIQINDVAEKYRKLIKGMNQESNPSSFRMGPPVELVDLDVEKTYSQDLYELIAQRVKTCINELGYAAENICIILSDIKNQKPNKIMAELAKLGIDSEGIKDKDYTIGGKVSLSTIQSCKGLDFPVVIMLADHRVHFNDSKYDDETVERLQRNMFYVAMTRAMDMLTIITWNNSESAVINDMKKCILESK
jgi:superfamily I DNA/RNA helicase